MPSPAPMRLGESMLSRKSRASSLSSPRRKTFPARSSRSTAGLRRGRELRTLAPMPDFESELQGELESIRAAGLLRELRRVDSAQGPHIEIAGRTLLNFSSNDYLGFA